MQYFREVYYIKCNGGEKKSSQSSITTSTKKCSEIFCIKCKFYTERIHEQKKAEKIKNVTFISNMSFRFYLWQTSVRRKTKISRFVIHCLRFSRRSQCFWCKNIYSGSSWCAPDPVSNDKHYFQVDLRPVYTCNFCCDLRCDFLLLI
jgi:hypothetical protein